MYVQLVLVHTYSTSIVHTYMMKLCLVGPGNPVLASHEKEAAMGDTHIYGEGKKMSSEKRC